MWSGAGATPLRSAGWRSPISSRFPSSVRGSWPCRDRRWHSLAGSPRHRLRRPAILARLGPPSDEWHSEPHYRIGDAVSGRRHLRHRALPAGQPPRRAHVFVLEAYDNRLSVWTPAGDAPVQRGPPGRGSGGLHDAVSRALRGLAVLRARPVESSHTSPTHGSLLETVPNPPNFARLPGIPAQDRRADLRTEASWVWPTMGRSIELGLFGDDPVDSLPVFSIRASAAGWVRDVVHWRDIRNTTFALTYNGWLHFSGTTLSGRRAVPVGSGCRNRSGLSGCRRTPRGGRGGVVRAFRGGRWNAIRGRYRLAPPVWRSSRSG